MWYPTQTSAVYAAGDPVERLVLTVATVNKAGNILSRDIHLGPKLGIASDPTAQLRPFGEAAVDMPLDEPLIMSCSNLDVRTNDRGLLLMGFAQLADETPLFVELLCTYETTTYTPSTIMAVPAGDWFAMLLASGCNTLTLTLSLVNVNNTILV
jgi:hypothetical protein